MPEYPPGFEPILPAAGGHPPGFEPITAPAWQQEQRPATFAEAQTEFEAGKRAIGQKVGSLWENLTTPVAAAVQPAANVVANVAGLLPEALKFLAVGGGAPQIAGAVQDPGRLAGAPTTTLGQAGAAIANPVNLVRTLPALGMTAGTLAAGPLGPLARILGGGIGGAAGAGISGGSLGAQAEQGLVGAGSAGLGEGLGAVGSKLARSWGRGAINEGQARELLGTFGQANPAIETAVRAQQVSPALGTRTTTAQMRQAATRGELQQAGSQRFEQALNEIDQAAGQPMLSGPEIDQAYQMLPDIVKQESVGPLGPIGGTYTLPQAVAIKAYLSSKAFAESPQGQGLDATSLQQFTGRLKSTIDQAIPPELQASWQSMNREYGAQQILNEFLTSARAQQGGPNQVLLNRTALSQYLDQNAQDIIRRMGPETYDAVVQGTLGGAQPGTRDVLAPGGGRPLAALLQTYGRGQGGSPQLLGAPLRTILPGLGDVYTGRAPYTLPPALQSILDLVTQRTTGQARQP
jgi:hypothetical protein